MRQPIPLRTVDFIGDSRHFGTGPAPFTREPSVRIDSERDIRNQEFVLSLQVRVPYERMQGAEQAEAWLFARLFSDAPIRDRITALNALYGSTSAFGAPVQPVSVPVQDPDHIAAAAEPPGRALRLED